MESLWNLLEYYRIYLIFSIYGLVSVWVKNMNGCENNYKSQGLVKVLKKTCGCCFW